MKKLSIQLIFSLIIMACGSIPKVEATNIDSNNMTLQNTEVVEPLHYPEDFLTMIYSKDINSNIVSEPFVYANGENANGSYRIAYYDDFDTFELSMSSGWSATQTVFKNQNFVTSEGISVGSEKKDVINAYEKYEIKECKLSMITQMGLDSLDIALKGINLSDTFIYVDNHNIFDENYTGIDYGGGAWSIYFHFRLRSMCC